MPCHFSFAILVKLKRYDVFVAVMCTCVWLERLLIWGNMSLRVQASRLASSAIFILQYWSGSRGLMCMYGLDALVKGCVILWNDGSDLYLNVWWTSMLKNSLYLVSWFSYFLHMGDRGAFAAIWWLWGGFECSLWLMCVASQVHCNTIPATAPLVSWSICKMRMKQTWIGTRLPWKKWVRTARARKATKREMVASSSIVEIEIFGAQTWHKKTDLPQMKFLEIWFTSSQKRYVTLTIVESSSMLRLVVQNAREGARGGCSVDVGYGRFLHLYFHSKASMRPTFVNRNCLHYQCFRLGI